MVVNNNVMLEVTNGLCIHKQTGNFFVDLLEGGNEVILFQFRMKYEGNDFLADFNILNRGFKIVSIKRRKSKSWAYLKALIFGFQTVKKADFVYLFYPGNICIILAIFCLLRGREYGFYVRGNQGIMSAISKMLYKKAKLVYTISPMFAELIRSTGASASTIRPMMDFSEQDILFNREYKNKATYDLLYVGRIERAKGVFELWDAIHYLVGHGTHNCKIHMVGDGADAKVLKDMTVESKLQDYITFHGTITEKKALSSFYENADLFIFPSHREGFPRVLYEAMIFGTPIITSFVGCIPYIMKDGYNCLETPTKDATGLATQIRRFVNDYELHSMVARNATKTIIEFLSEKKVKHSIQLINAIKPSVLHVPR
jgi:glycosyltransferase involved in cell wall biosynthesis